MTPRSVNGDDKGSGGGGRKRQQKKVRRTRMFGSAKDKDKGRGEGHKSGTSSALSPSPSRPDLPPGSNGSPSIFSDDAKDAAREDDHHGFDPRNKRAKKIKKREQKWSNMINESSGGGGRGGMRRTKASHRRMIRRARKGVPLTLRGDAWVAIGNVDAKIASRQKKGQTSFLGLVRRSGTDKEEFELGRGLNVNDNGANDGTDEELKNGSVISKRSDVPSSFNRYGPPPSPKATMDTIERDINRTFPRHYMFYDLSEHDNNDNGNELRGGRGSSSSSSLSNTNNRDNGDREEGGLSDAEPFFNGWNRGGREQDEDGSDDNIVADWTERATKGRGRHATDAAPIDVGGGGGGNREISNSAAQEVGSRIPPGDGAVVKDYAVAIGGQASLRRVLRAYAAYDPEVGYCQGMNFIAAMFLTFMSEERSFWLLAYVMNDQPCRMRGLFGEGMADAHRVLHVAERLIHRFLPKLSSHLEVEGVHITMYATQWLLTLYASSFPFSLVTRVWDCFLAEGWKVVYRVMLTLLANAQTELLNMRFEDILGYFRSLPDCVDGDAVLDRAKSLPLRWRHIEKYEKEWVAKQGVSNGGGDNGGRRL